MNSSSLFFITTLIIFSLHLSSAYRVINTFHDTVHAGDVKYYTLESTSPVIIALYSIEGDADMYGSPARKNSKPSADSFDYMSVSCGLDLVVLPMSDSLKRVSLGIFGHMRHENTTYQAWVVEPEKEDLLRYQVWEIDPETRASVLVIDTDPLVLANDPTLHILLESLYSDGQRIKRPRSGASDVIWKAFEWTGYVLLKLLEIGIEILVT